MTITLPPPARAICCFERPILIGESDGMVDFGDTFAWISVWTTAFPVPNGLEIIAGDALEFDLKFPTPAGTVEPPFSDNTGATRKYGVDLKFVAGPYLSDVPILNQNGVDVAAGDKAGLDDVWYHETASLSGFEGLILSSFLLTCDEDTGAANKRYVAFYKNIAITNGGAVRHELWLAGAAPNGSILPLGLPSVAPFPSVFATGLFSYVTLDVGIEGPLNVFGPITGDTVGGGFVSKNQTTPTATPYTVTAFDSTVINVVGTMTFNLPTAVLIAGRRYTFVNAHASATLTIDPFSTQTINRPGGAVSTVALATQWATLSIESNGANWIEV